MNILVAYATNSSGTLVASTIIAEKLQTAHTVMHKDIRLVKPEDLSSHDLIIFGSPSWDYHSPTGRLEGQPHEFFRRFISESVNMHFPDKKFAVFGLGDTAYINFCGAVNHLEAFVEKLGGKLATPSLRIDGFYFDQPNNEAKVAMWVDELAKVLV